MADIRIKDLPTTATQTASDDFIALDGTVNGTRKIDASAPSFKTSVTSPSVVAPTTTNLTLAGGSTGASLVLGQGANANASVAPAGTGSLIVTKNSTGNNVPGIILKNGAAGYTELDLYSGVSDTVKLLLQASDASSLAALSVATNHPLLFGVNASEKMRIATTGNLLIGTTTDGGQKLQVAGTAAFTGAVTMSGTGTGLTLSPASGSATLAINGTAAGSAINYQLSGANKYTAEYVSGSDFYAIGRSGVAYDLVLKSGNALIGTTTDSGNGKLQLATHTTSAGGIGFGTDNQLFRYSSIQLALTNSSGTSGSAIASNMQLRVENSGNGGIQVNVPDASTGGVYFGRSTDAYYTGIERSGTNLQLRNAGATALTLASTGAATFAGAVTVSSTGTSSIAGKLGLGVSDGFRKLVVAGTDGVDTNMIRVNNINASGAAVTTGIELVSGDYEGRKTYAGFRLVHKGDLNNGGEFGIESTYFGNVYSRRFTISDPLGNATYKTTINTAVAEITGTTPSTGAGSGALQVAGGIYSGATSYFGGDLNVTRASAGLVAAQIYNSTSGTGAISGLEIRANNHTGIIYSLSDAFTSSGQYLASGTILEARGSAGLMLSGYTSGPVKIWAANGLRATFDASAATFAGAVTANGGLSIPANTFLSIGTFGGATGFKQDTPTTDSIEIWNKGLKVALISQSQMTMLGAAGGGRFVNFATGTTSASLRWVTGANGTAESGSNAGSDYQIHRYSDAGASLGTAFSITRATGAATFAGAVAINNTVATAVAVASTHKVTMVIGGVTYYLLASNV